MGIRDPLSSWSRYNSAAIPSDAAPEFMLQAAKLLNRIFAPPDRPAPTSVMFCAVERGAGCSSFCGRTAELLASQFPGTVCVVDANLRAPSLHRHFHLENRKGFSDALVRPESMYGFTQQVQGSNLWVLTAGTSLNASLQASSGKVYSQILTLRTLFDYVLIDVSPLNLSPDAKLLGKLVDGAVLVIESKVDTRQSAVKATEMLRAARIPILGAVLNKWTVARLPRSNATSALTLARKPAADGLAKRAVAFKDAAVKAFHEKPKTAAPVTPKKAAPVAPKTAAVHAVARGPRAQRPPEPAEQEGRKKFSWSGSAPQAGAALGVDRKPPSSEPQVRNGAIKQDANAPLEAFQKQPPKPSSPPVRVAQAVVSTEHLQAAKILEVRAEAPNPTVEVIAVPSAPERRAPSSAKKPAPAEFDKAEEKYGARYEVPTWARTNPAPPSSPVWRSRSFVTMICIMAVGTTLWLAGEPRPAPSQRQEIRETAPAVASHPLGLKVDRAGRMLHIVWDRTSASATNSKGGLLAIQDGKRLKRLHLDAGEIRSGNLYYRPRTADVSIRLEVEAQNGATAAESVTAGGAASPAQTTSPRF